MSSFPRLPALLREAMAAHNVPGASVALLADGAVSEVAAGVCNVETGVPVTPDTLFQIGSITKLYTAALAMMLVEQGKLDLDRPVRETLQDFRLADEEAAAAVTLGHLLDHTSGIDGDLFRNTGRGEERFERFVGGLADAAQIHAPGALFSYCNAGYVVAGRMIEKVLDLGWDKALRQLLVKPLGTPAFSTLPEQAMRHQIAIGHLGGLEEEPRVTPIAYLAQSNGPAGATPLAKARDVIGFAKWLLSEGVTADGTRLLDSALLERMFESRIACPPGFHAEAWGLGFMLFDYGEGPGGVVGHDGSTIGQRALFRVHRESGMAIVILTNGGDGVGLIDVVQREVFKTVLGLKPKAPPQPQDAAGDLSPYEGRFERGGGTIEVAARDDQLEVKRTPAPDVAPFEPARSLRMVSAGDGVFVEDGSPWTVPEVVSFIGDEQGRAAFLHTSARAWPRVQAGRGS